MSLGWGRLVDWLVKNCGNTFRPREGAGYISNNMSVALTLLGVNSCKIENTIQELLSFYEVSLDKIIGITRHKLTNHSFQLCFIILDYHLYTQNKRASAGDLSHF